MMLPTETLDLVVSLTMTSSGFSIRLNRINSCVSSPPYSMNHIPITSSPIAHNLRSPWTFTSSQTARIYFSHAQWA
ncbi:MAG: hypothetical protein M2R45_02148 [Verrucomicrobia subdivision 3 bacterium]|nr:hypothetical protein [Limisphaerales bacterium]MCS1413725.1 hypothetical protein [Limisphaerales bacterium]